MQVSKVAGSACSYAAFPSSIKSRYCTSTIGEMSDLTPPHSPTITLARTPAAGAIDGMLLALMSLYAGGSILCFAGRLIQHWKPWSGPPGWPVPSLCSMPLAAVIHWQSPSLSTPLLPIESSWPQVPCLTYMTVSIPRCGCHGAPGNSPGR